MLRGGGTGETNSYSHRDELCGKPGFPKVQVPPSPHPSTLEAETLAMFGFTRYCCRGPTAYFKVDSFFWRQPQKAPLPHLNSGGHSVQQEKCFFEGRSTVRLGSKHLPGTVSLGGFCIERAVRRETSNFCGARCSQRDVRGLLLREPGSGPCFSSLASGFRGVGRGARGTVKPNSWRGTHEGGLTAEGP